MPERFVSAREAASLVGRVERTVRRWIERGVLAAEKDATSGEFRIPVSALAVFGYTEPMEDPTPPTPPSTDAERVASAAELAAYDAADRAAEDGWLERAVRAETLVKIAAHLAAAEAWPALELVLRDYA